MDAEMYSKSHIHVRISLHLLWSTQVVLAFLGFSGNIAAPLSQHKYRHFIIEDRQYQPPYHSCLVSHLKSLDVMCSDFDFKLR